MKMLIVVILLLTTAGCQNTQTVYVPQTSYIVMDDDWLKDCNIVPPPDQVIYRTSPEGVKTVLWSKVYANQIMELDICNKGKAKARAFNKTAREKNAQSIRQ